MMGPDDAGNPRRLSPRLLDSAARAVRDPLTVVLGVSARLRTQAASDDEPNLIQDAETIDQAASRLRLSFESLLALLEIDHGRDLELESFDLAAVAQEAVAAGVRRGAHDVPVYGETSEVTIESDSRLVRLLIGQLLAIASTALREVRVTRTGGGASLELFLEGDLVLAREHHKDASYGLPTFAIAEAMAKRLGVAVTIERSEGGAARIAVTFPGCHDGALPSTALSAGERGSR